MRTNEQNELEAKLLEDGRPGTSVDENYKGMKLKPSFLIVLPTSILTAFLLVGLIPLLPELQVEWFKSYKNAQFYGGILTSIQAALTFFSAPQAGAFSDVYGRKPMLILTALFSVLPIFVLYLTDGSSYQAYYSVLIIGGFLGIGRTSSFAFLASYVADCSAPEVRTRNIGYVGATAGVAMALTPVLNSMHRYLSSSDFLLLLLLIGVVNILYICLIVPESKVFDSRERASNNEKVNVFRIVNPVKPLKLLLRNRVMKVLSIVIIFAQLPEDGVAQVAVLYLNEVYGLKGDEIQEFDSLVFGAMGLSLIISLSVVLPMMLKLNFSFSFIIFITQIANCMHMMFYGSISHFPRWMFFLNCIPIGFCFIMEPAVNSFVSFNIDKNDYGLAFGTLGSIKGICGIIGPLLFSEIYAATGDGTTFFVGVFMAFLAVLITWFKLRKVELEVQQQKSVVVVTYQ